MMKRIFSSTRLILPAAGIGLISMIVFWPLSKDGNTSSIRFATEFSTTGEAIKPATMVSLQGVEGLWIGKYIADDLDQEPLFYSFSIFPDGTIMTKSLGGDGRTYYSAGTWKLEKEEFTSEIAWIPNRYGKPVEQLIKAKFINGSFVDAIWKDTNNPNPGSRMNKGKFIGFERAGTHSPCDELITRVKTNQ